MSTKLWERSKSLEPQESLFVCRLDFPFLPSAEEADLFADLHSLTRNSTLRKLNDLIKRAKLARVHALIVAELRAQMPLLLGKEQRRVELVAGLQDTFARVEREHGVPAGLSTIC